MMLHFADPPKLKTKKVVFEEKYYARDSGTLEQLKELSSTRRVIEESINNKSLITKAVAREISGGSTLQCDQDIQKLEKYLPLLENLVHHVNLASDNPRLLRWTSDLKIRWSSALTSSSFFNFKCQKFFQIDNLLFEVNMMLFLYGALLRECASDVLSQDLVQSATLFRKAAGVYHSLAHEVLPSLQPALPPERPPETTSSVSSVMSLICLAEAQAVTIRKAEKKGNTGSLLAKLHYGVVQILDEATVIIHSANKDSKDISAHFVEFISSCKALHELRSYKYLAECLKTDGQIGVALGVLQHALITAQKNKPPGKETWRLVLKQEVDSMAELMRKFEHENNFVWKDKIPTHHDLPLPEGWEELFLLWFLKKKLWARVLLGLTCSNSLTWSWLWEVGGLRILVDPILVGNLDFGIPWLYDAAKKFLKTFQLSDLPEIDYLLITQSLDDHCHLKTLKPLAQKLPNLRVIATPNAKALLDPLFKNVKYLEPGQSFELEASNGSQVKVQATSGPVLGPPWQRPENGYLVTSPQGQLTLYYEPHCVYNRTFLEKERADIVITPVIKQLLPKFTLVSGQEDAVQLAKLLRAKFIVPMQNGELDSKGLLATLVQSDGTVESFKELLSKEVPDAKVLEPTPGIPLDILAS